MLMQAFLWGAVAGGALLVGAFVGYFANLPKMLSSSVMAFGIGVLVSALSFDLMSEAYLVGGLWGSVAGFVAGAALYAIANFILASAGAKHRKKSSGAAGGAAIAIAIGSLLDGIPESAAIGISLLDGEGVALVTVIAIFVSNIPEGLSSSTGMKAEGRSAGYVFSLWGGIAALCAVASLLGYAVIGGLDETWIGAATAVAAGAIFVMLIDTMVPEAFEEIHGLSGIMAAGGFLFAFCLSHLL
ncbi:ZIP family metal transporter [Pukyongiella litopenaei]|uniref:ZIP family zinc transporter n=1 Tax=Pukyongiella litopenaei TaxID=2605946 RepID=A0A2S0MQU8_9RHOB|nr:ZIP family zinc transporter [Pukyongiella litopenaei]AVO38258.1 ZIP family zinc transporter [Pukyongiella litopenaei]